MTVEVLRVLLSKVPDDYPISIKFYDNEMKMERILNIESIEIKLTDESTEAFFIGR